MQKVLIGGGTGLIGQRLSVLLEEEGYQVSHLSRRANPNARFPAYQWDPIAGTIDSSVVAKADYIINMAGAGIADKAWTEQRKRVIIDSRVKSNELLFRTLKESGKKVKAFLAATAVGYYGHGGDRKLVESDKPLNDGFLSASCIAWEDSLEGIADICDRDLIIRIGIVLSTKGGALEKMLLPLSFGMSNYFGSGSQYTAWLHIDDICRLFIAGIQNEKMQGVYNGTAPEPVTSKALAYAIKEAKGSWALVLSAPAFALRLALGERVAMLISSTRAVPERKLAAGFEFKYPNLAEAIKDILKHKK